MRKVLGVRAAASVVALLSGCALSLAGGEALAQPKPDAAKPEGDKAPPKKFASQKQRIEEAKKLFGQAKEKFEAGDFVAAASFYRQADEVYPGANPKYFAAVSLDKAGRLEEAMTAYKGFVAYIESGSVDDKKKYAEKVEASTKRLEEIPKTPARVTVSTQPPAVPGLALTVDGAAQPGPELAIPPGKHEIGATAEGYEPAKVAVEVTFGEKRDVTIELKGASRAPVAAAPPTKSPEPAPAPPPKADPGAEEGSSKVPAYVTLGLAGAGAVVGTIFGVMALGAKSDFEAAPTTENADAAERNALISDMSFAVAITFGVTGTVLLLSSGQDKPKTGRPAPPPPRRAWIAPYAGPKGGGAAAGIHF